MPVAAVNGATLVDGIGATSITVNYAPLAGNMIFVALALQNTATPTVADNNGVPLTLAASQVEGSGTTVGFIFFGIAAPGATSYTASWTGTLTSGMLVEEYSGVASVQFNATFVNSGTAGPAQMQLLLPDVNYWLVGGLFGAAVSLTSGQGNQRQNTTGGGLRSAIQDNTASVRKTVQIGSGNALTAWATAALFLLPFVPSGVGMVDSGDCTWLGGDEF